MKFYPALSTLLLSIVFICFSCSKKSAPLPEPLTQSIEKRIEYGLNGAVAIGIIDQEGIRYYNFGSKDASGGEVNEHTIFEIGSITKTFTATLLAEQAKKGILHTTDPANEFLPDSAKIETQEDQLITLGHLSDHTSGLPGMPSNFQPANPNNPFADYSVEDLYTFMSTYKPENAPGSTCEYSNLGVGLLGHILASNAGKTYEDLLNTVVTKPLGLEETNITLDETMKLHLAEGRDEFGRRTENWDFDALASAGALRSSTSDMIRYLSAQIGLIQTPLDAAIELTQQIRHKKYPVRGGAETLEMGLGWIITPHPEGDIYWHTGVTGGYKSYIAFNKSTQKGVIVLATGDDASDIGAYLMSVDSLKEIRRFLATDLAYKIDQQGVESAQLYFEDEVLNQLEDFVYGSYPLNRLGYSYLQKDNLEAALAIFEINIQLFPDSWNVYDSYGEALRKSGRLQESLKQYKKSVDLNPENVNAINVIGELEKEIGMQDQ